MNYPTENKESDFNDPMSQWAISMERLFSCTPVPDQEFDEIGGVLFRMEREYRINVLNLLFGGVFFSGSQNETFN